MTAVVDAVLAHIMPRVVVAFSESEDKHYLTMSWGGVYIDHDVSAFYIDAVHGKNGAIQAIKDLAHDLVKEMARAIVARYGERSMNPPAIPEETDATLAAEIEASEDEGGLH